MPYVLTVDQKASRRSADRVADVLPRLNAAVATVLPFERTAGDEFQGVLDDPEEVVDVVLRPGAAGGWSIGIGAGPVQTPAAAEHPRRRRSGVPQRPAGRGRGQAAALAAGRPRRRRPPTPATRRRC